MQPHSFPNLARRDFLRQSATVAAGLSLIGPSFSAPLPTDLTFLTLAEAADLVRRRKVSPVDLTQACLKRIELLNPKLNAFITVTAEQAMAQARQAEDEIKQGKYRGPLHGIPISLKDSIETAGVLTTSASRAYEKNIPAADAEVVTRMKQAGAVLMGKNNMDELARSILGVSSYYGPIHNAWNPELIAGGSSGGSSVAVATGMVFGAIGTDAGGSLRIPAAYNNIVGFKASHGLTSLRGVMPFTWSCFHVGPQARTAEDTALLLQVIAGYDPLDPMSQKVVLPDYRTALRPKSAALRIGLVGLKTQPEELIRAKVSEAVMIFQASGATTRDVPLPEAPPAASLIFRGEDHAHYEPLVNANPDRFNADFAKAYTEPSKTTADQMITAYRDFALMRRTVGAIFDTVDVLVLPTTHGLPPSIGVAQTGKVPGRSETVSLNIWSNLFGLPAISIPCGFSPEGLPIGLQLVGPRFGEATVLAVAHQYQQATDWHKRHPQGLLAMK